MHTIKSHFEIHSRFRNGIFLLSILLFICVLIYFFYPKSQNSQQDFVELTKFQHHVDSLKKIAQEKKNDFRLKPFNPNFISDYKGYQLGLTPDQLDRLFAYRNQDKWINSATDFKNVTQVSDSLLAAISPLFKFPKWIKNNRTHKKHKKNKLPARSFDQKEDLAVVSAKMIQEKVNIPDFIAERIIRYREKIGGFVGDTQLQDIAGLYNHQRKKILSFFTVKTPRNIKRININEASIDQLIEVPYFDFEMALEVRDFIEDNQGISSFEELGKINGFSLEKIDRIALYLKLN